MRRRWETRISAESEALLDLTVRVFAQSGLSALEVFTENGFLFQFTSIKLAPNPDYLETARMSIKNIKYFIKYFNIEDQIGPGWNVKSYP